MERKPADFATWAPNLQRQWLNNVAQAQQAAARIAASRASQPQPKQEPQQAEPEQEEQEDQPEVCAPTGLSTATYLFDSPVSQAC